jgi:hypothetical protein
MYKLLAFHCLLYSQIYRNSPNIHIYFVSLDTHISCLIYKDLLISSESESAYSHLMIHKILLTIFTVRMIRT